jgi:hypothetical protein
MKDLGLPKETIDFLKSGKQFVYDPTQCEAGIVKLKNFEELEINEIWVNCDRYSILDGNPHADEDVYYAVKSVNLHRQVQ